MSRVERRRGVSVLIRSMNRHTLHDALRSVAEQLHDEIEVVVINATGGMHMDLAGTCGRFSLRLIDPGRALGRAEAANLALDNACREWVLFLDDDDLIDPDHIEKLRTALDDAPGYEVAYSGVRVLRENGTLQTEIDEVFDTQRFWLANYLPMHAVMFASRLAGSDQRFDIAMSVYEDWDFWFRLAQHHPFLHVAGVSATYRLIGQSGLSAEPDQAVTLAGRRHFYRKWRPLLSDEVVEALMARAELERAHYATSTRALADARAAARSASEEATRLQIELTKARGREELLVGQAERDKQLLAQLDVSRRELMTHVADVKREYARLEKGYRQVTGSLSWRLTEPLRAVRGLAQGSAVRELARKRIWRGLRALPISPSARQKLKVELATRPWGAPVLRWLMAVRPATDQPGACNRPEATPAPELDKEAVRLDAERTLTRFLESGERLSFPTSSSKPRVSVVVVLFNQAGLSLLCLKGLARLRALDLQLIIVDNASSDRVPELLSRIDGAHIQREMENRGFLRAVNSAACSATGEYLLLLNNDAVVSDDAIERAATRLDTDPDVGAVGGAILLWDGRLQEAGSVIWSDGSCLGYGRGEPPGAGQYRFVRDVDYCSGAFLMTRRALFDGMGRLDDRYAPAYYEESDYCVRLIEAGHRVVYDPSVRIRHFEFASDIGQGRALELQARNRGVFAQVHSGFLARQYPPARANVLLGRMRLVGGAHRVLFIDDRVPLPWLGQGYPRACRFVQALVAAGDFVTHYPLQFPSEDWGDVYRALHERVEVMLDLGLAGIASFLAERTGYYDAMVISRPHNMEVVMALRERHPEWFRGVRIVYDAEALFSVRDIAKARLIGEPLPAAQQEQLIRAELALARGADCVVAVSVAEARHYRDAGYADVHVLGHALACRPGGTDFQARQGLLFVGAVPFDDSPNGDSLIWFLREVWPHVVRELGEQVVLDIVGPCESETIRAMCSAQVRAHGKVAAVQPYYDAARVFIVPTRYAAGLPHKAHEAAAHGLPMVVTQMISEQLGWKHEVQVAADAGDFAMACVRLYNDNALWQSQRSELLRCVERDCSEAAFDAAVSRIMCRSSVAVPPLS